MTFKDMLDSDRDIFFNTEEFADTAVYTPTDGAPIAIVLIPDIQEDPNTISSGMGQGQHINAFFELRSDQIASPKLGDMITYKAKEWTVRKVTNGRDGRSLQIFATTSERANL